MLSARDLTLRRAAEPLFEHVNFTIYRGDRVGLTGANGSGKSSLFAAICGTLGADRGDLEIPASLKIAHLEQEIPSVDRPAIEFVLDGDTELRRVTAAIEDAERRDAAMELADLHAALDAIDGYRARARAASIMHGLGFEAAQHERRVAEFSGGWRVRLSMARALNSRADLLLLDEPTNHLDLDAIVWLEEWLQAAPSTLIIVSHDREFLDAVIGRVLHIENRAIRSYPGNYSQFEQKRSEDLALQQSLKVRQVRRIAEITSFVNRFRAKATKARQAQSRLRMLEKMERIVPAHVDSPFKFEFARPLKTPRPLLTLEAAACGYAPRIVLGGIDVSIGPQDRIALVGPNGAGKSTLTKLLADESAPLAGRRTPAADLAIGYFAQQQMEQLIPAESAFWHMRELAGPDYASGEEQRVRDHLGKFGFQGDAVFEPVARFSGGEKARLALALLVARRPNLLLLDEPTNHLDIEMRHALTVALQGFEGGLIVVSHDRHLIKTVADTLWLAADGKLRVFEGDLDDYQAWLRARGKARSGSRPAAAPPRKAPATNPLIHWRRELSQIEKKLAAIAAERALIEDRLGGPPDVDAHAKLLETYARLTGDAAKWEARWLEVGTAIEEAEADRAAP
ncbi:MAG TPA: ATP-binding cassette domain-containing protein [Steroidobacteraceae bacterium]|jgi:ATP-binding cassette subfamily F protein 3|nr:ATP-binding cassette domain-containing protein [Steroidobacteraceae bacterium]